MSIVISIDTSNGLSEQDVTILGAIAGAVGAVATVLPTATAKPATPAAAPAKKAAAAKPAPVAEPDPAPEADEDLLGGDGPTKEDAVKRATEMVAEGKAKEVKAALVTVGVAKVGQLDTPELVAAWFAALDA